MQGDGLQSEGERTSRWDTVNKKTKSCEGVESGSVKCISSSCVLNQQQSEHSGELDGAQESGCQVQRYQAGTVTVSKLVFFLKRNINIEYYCLFFSANKTFQTQKFQSQHFLNLFSSFFLFFSNKSYFFNAKICLWLRVLNRNWDTPILICIIMKLGEITGREHRVKKKKMIWQVRIFVGSGSLWWDKRDNLKNFHWIVVQ